MAVYRVDLRCDDPQPIFDWLQANVRVGGVVRKIGYQLRNGWYMKIVFKQQPDAESFHRQFFPNETDHDVPVYKTPELQQA